MVLSVNDHRALLKGFEAAGFLCKQAPSSATNPIQIEWHVDDNVRRYRLWAFDVTHGGGGSEVRAPDEFRIQITNGPAKPSEFDQNHVRDLLIGYSRDRDAIIAYDRRWLENWSRKKAETGSGGSPSVQVKEADIQAGHDKGIHHLTKSANFGEADIVTLSPTRLPAYLLNHDAVLRGQMTAEEAETTTPQVAGATVVDYCLSQGFPFESDLIARYLAALLTKPFVILAGISGTGKSKLAELVAEFYSAESGPGEGVESTPVTADSFVFVPAKGAPDELYDAVMCLGDHRIRVSVYNHQLCTLDRRLWPFAAKSISDWKNEYMPACTGCLEQERCGGFFASSAIRHSDHIRPFL